MSKSVMFTLFLTILGITALAPAQAQDELVYVAVPPCRIVDTRNAGGVITANDFRNFRVSGTSGELAVQGGETDCLDPKADSGQKPLAISAYVIAVPTGESTSGVLTAYPSDQQPPPVGAGSTVNFVAGQPIGNTTNITLCDPADSCPADGEFAIMARSTDQHVVIDVQGYFYPSGEIYVKSNGTNIGLQVGVFDTTGIIPPPSFHVFNNREYAFQVNFQGQLSPLHTIYYEGDNCTGQAYTLLSKVPYVSAHGFVFTRPDTSTVSYVAKGARSVSVQIVSSNFTIYGATCETFSEPLIRYALPVLQNDPSVTGVQNSYDPPITVGY